MLYWLWLKRTLLSRRGLFEARPLFSIAGLSLAAAALTAALLVVSGFSASIERAIIGKTGDLSVLSKKPAPRGELFLPMLPHQELVQDQAAFLSFAGMILSKGRFKGAIFEGLDDERFKKDPFLRQRILEGSLEGLPGGEPFAVIGRAMAKDLNLRPGSFVSVVALPEGESLYFSRKRQSFPVGAVADFGRHDFNSRYVLIPLSAAEALLGREGLVSGARFWLKRPDRAAELVRQMRAEKYGCCHIAHWKDTDRWFFKMIEMDKKIIFFVLFIMIIAAGFNVSSALFVHVFRRARDISVLKAAGAAPETVRNIFLLEGLVTGVLGLSLGAAMGWGIVAALIFAQNKWHFIPEEAYQANEIVISADPLDAAALILSSLFVIVLASLIPARRAYNRDIKEGLACE